MEVRSRSAILVASKSDKACHTAMRHAVLCNRFSPHGSRPREILPHLSRDESSGRIELEPPRNVAVDEQITEGATETHGDQAVRRERGVARLKRIEHRENPLGADARSHASCAQRGFYSGYCAVLSAARDPIHRHKYGAQRDCGHSPSHG